MNGDNAGPSTRSETQSVTPWAAPESAMRRTLSAGDPGYEPESIATRQLSQLQLALTRLRRHRLAMIGIGILSFMIVVAIFAPLIAPENIYDTTSNDIFNARDK